MNKQVAVLFDKFYAIILRDQIQDPLIHSEWVYFQSMMSGENFERDRVSMYLTILENEKKKKPVFLNHRESFDFAQPKLDKRFSEPAKHDHMNVKGKELGFRQNKLRIETRLSNQEERQNGRKPEGKVNYRRLLQVANNLVNMMEANTPKIL